MKLPKKIIDANVILRFFLGDDEEKFLKAKVFIQKVEFGEEEILLGELVFAEVIWVLDKVYKIPRKEIVDKLSKFISYKGVKTILTKDIFLESLKLYAVHSIDIQDIFLFVLSKTEDSFVITFDKTDFKKLNGNFSEP
ncbi:MAG: PIN domain-containing protein [bacterium]